MRKTAIVTGANGFIGKNVVKELLNKGYFVYAITVDDKSLTDIESDNLKNLALFFDDYPKMLELIKESEIDIFIHGFPPLQFLLPALSVPLPPL